MLDINFIRANQGLVEDNLKKRKITNVNLKRLLTLDEKRRELILQIESLRKEKNKLSLAPNPETIRKAKALKEKLGHLEPELKKIAAEFQEIMLSLPNMADPEVPEGEGEEDNKVIKKWGKPRQFDFPFKDHLTLGEELGIIDLKRGAKVSGTGFYYLKNEGALLEIAVMKFVIDKLYQKGFQFIITPDLVKREAMVGTGFFPSEEDEVYKIEKDALYLIGTAEVPLASYHSGETLQEKALPIYYAGFSSCFRREAGSYGKEGRGVFRVHQFNKVEMFVICRPEDSEGEHQKLLRLSEEILQELKLPYEVVINCLGDLGFPNRKRYDINTWMPYWKGYRETHSASNDGDFQARRLNIRYRTKTGDIRFCHTLNNTAVASPRIMVAILENYQQKDGSIEVPAVLQPYLPFKAIKVGKPSKK